MFNCVISMFNCSQIVTHKQKLTKLKRTSVHQKVQLVNSVALLVSIMIIVTAGHGELQYLEEIGQGAFGRVFLGQPEKSNSYCYAVIFVAHKTSCTVFSDGM